MADLSDPWLDILAVPKSNAWGMAGLFRGVNQ
jgi:hypothetical protein